MEKIIGGKWYQTIDFDGRLTRGKKGKGDTEKTWGNIKQLLPKTLKGMRILDLGCNAGMYCVKSSLMGAREVVGIEGNPYYMKQALFVKDYMEKKFDRSMNIRYIHGSVHESIRGLGKFDIIFAFSVLYHIRGNHIDDVCEWIVKNTDAIIARLRNEDDISKYSGIFAKLGFRGRKRFDEVNIYGKGRKKYLVRFTKG